MDIFYSLEEKELQDNSMRIREWNRLTEWLILNDQIIMLDIRFEKEMLSIAIIQHTIESRDQFGFVESEEILLD